MFLVVTTKTSPIWDNLIVNCSLQPTKSFEDALSLSKGSQTESGFILESNVSIDQLTELISSFRRVLVCYLRPSYELAAPLAKNEEFESVFVAWKGHTDSLLDVFKHNRSKVSFIDLCDLVHIEGSSLSSLAEFGIPLKTKMNEFRSDIYTLVSHQHIHQSPQLLETLKRLEACTTRFAAVDALLPLKSVLNNFREEYIHSNSELDDLKVKNNNLTDEAHNLRLELNDLKEIHKSEIAETKENLEGATEKLHQTREQQQQTANELQQTKEQQQHTANELQQAKEQQQQTSNELQQAKEQQQHTANELQQAKEQEQHTANELQQAKEQEQHRANELQQAKEQQQQTASELQQAKEQQQHTANELQQAKEQLQHRANELQHAKEQQQHMANKLQQAKEQQQQTANELQQAREQQQHTANELQQAKEQQHHTENELQRTREQEQHTANEMQQLKELQQYTANELQQAREQQQNTANENAHMRGENSILSDNVSELQSSLQKQIAKRQALLFKVKHHRSLYKSSQVDALQQIDNLQNLLNSKEHAIFELTLAKEEHKALLERKDTELIQSNQKVDALTKQLTETDNKCKELWNHNEQQQLSLESAIQNCDAYSKQLEQQSIEFERAQQELKEQHQVLLTGNSEHYEELLSSLRNEQKEKLEESRKEHEIQLAAIRDEQDSLLQVFHEKSASKLDQLEREHHSQLQELSQQHESSLEKLRQSNESALSDAENEHQLMLQRTSEYYELQLVESRQIFESQKQQILTDYENQAQRMESDLRALRNQVERLEGEKQKAQSESVVKVKRLERDIIKLDKQLNQKYVENAAKKFELIELNRRLNVINNSLSWKAGSPIRALSRVFVKEDPKQAEFQANVELVKFSGLFDSVWYLRNNADVLSSGANPIEHYLQYGAKEGRNPSYEFDGNWYLEQYPDAASAGINPLVHYIRFGLAEGRSTSPKLLVNRIDNEEG